MSGDKVLVEELLKHGDDQGAKAKKKGVRGGAELTPKELAEATAFTKAEEDQRRDQRNEIEVNQY